MSISPGQTIGQYLIQEKIGEGGMGAVFKADQTAIHRTVVLKVLSANIANDTNALDRFNREVDIISRLEHPHILPVYDYGQVAGSPYIVMRYMGGGSLLDRLRARNISREQLLRNLDQIAEALDYAHERDVVHRDLKPANVLLDERGNAYLADFGLAKTMEGSGDLTKTGSILGTPAYMSPEQARGEKLDGCSDIYSLAVMTYEALAGRLPFQASSAWEYIQKHLVESPPSILNTAPDLPAAVDEVLRVALAKDRQRRPAKASEFVKSLRTALAGTTGTAFGGQAAASTRANVAGATVAEATTLAPTRAATAIARPATRTMWAIPVVGLLMMVGVVAIAAAAAIIFAASQRGTFGSKAATYPVGDSPRALLYDGQAMWVANFFDNTVTQLSASDCDASPDPCGKAINTIPVDNLPLGLAHDGESLWVASALNSKLTKLNPQTGEELGRYTLPSVPSALLYADGHLWTANSFASTVTKIGLDGTIIGSYAVGNSPQALAFDSKTLWVANKSDGTFTQLNLVDGSIVRTVALDGQPSAVAFDGTHIWAALEDQNKIEEIDPTDGTILGWVVVGKRPLALMFDGAALWSAEQDGNSITRIDVTNAKVISTISIAGGPYALAWSPCGDGCREVWVANQGNDTVNRVRVIGK